MKILVFILVVLLIYFIIKVVKVSLKLFIRILLGVVLVGFLLMPSIESFKNNDNFQELVSDKEAISEVTYELVTEGVPYVLEDLYGEQRDEFTKYVKESFPSIFKEDTLLTQ